MAEKRHLTSTKIIEMYKNGERDFSGAVCMGADFPKAKLSGSNFKGANLSYCSFNEADISDCDFTNANLEWSSFKNADMRKSNFTKANLSWSVLNKAKLDGAILENANVSWCLLFDVDIDKADRKGTDFTMSAFHPSQVTREGRLAVMRALAGKRDSLPFDLALELEFIVKTGDIEIQKALSINVEERTSAYNIPTNVGYGIKGAKDLSVSAPEGYSTGVEYGQKKKRKDSYE
jgi:hypothetical protein